jgi:hypothetical protein
MGISKTDKNPRNPEKLGENQRKKEISSKKV